MPQDARVALKMTLDAWLRAQNRGDFDAYRSLYAERFTGIKRSGDRVFRAGRDGWLEDRKKMFARPLTVKATDVSFDGSRTMGRIEFVQDFRTPTYHDRGPKELRLTRDGKSWKIVREEMLRSEVGTPKATQTRVEPAHFSFVRKTDKGLLILLDRYDSLNPVHGSLEYAGDARAIRPVKPELVEKRYRELAGRPFRVFDASGKTCHVTPGELTLYVEMHPHFGQLQAWNGEQPGEPKATPQQRALDVWQSVGRRRWIALRAPDSTCAGEWARAAGLKAPVFFERVSKRGTERIEQRALADLKQTPGYRELAELKSTEESSNRFEWHTSSRLFESPGGVRFVATSIQLGQGACAEYAGRHLGIFRQHGESLKRLSDPAEAYGAGPLGSKYSVVREPRLPEKVFDLDSNGQPELLFDNVLYGFAGDRYQIVREAQVLDLDCPC